MNKFRYYKKLFLVGLSAFFNRQLTGPLEVLLSISNKCDIGCLSCFEFSNDPDMKFSVIKRLFNDLDKINTYRVILAGSKNPLEYEKLPELIEYAQNKKFELSIITNLLTFEDMYYLKKFDSFVVSLLAVTKSTFVKVFKNKKFEDQLKAIKNLKKYKKKIRRISVTLFEQNYEDLPHFLRFAKELKVPIFFNHAITSHKPFLEIQNLNKLAKFIKKGVKYSEENNIKSNIGELASYNKKKRIPCFAGFWQSFININGGVYYCCRNSQLLGDINKTSFIKIWYSKGYSKLRKTRYSPGEGDCSECLIAHINQKFSKIFSF